MSALNRRTASGLRQTSSNTSNNEPPVNNTLLTKEEEYKRLNAELEKKTANLVFEAEQVLKANEKLIHETDYLNKISDVDFRENEEKLDVQNKQQIYEYSDDSEHENNYEELLGNKGRPSGKSVRSLVGQLVDEENFACDNANGLIPKSANDMSSTAQIRFLKAKLKVMQEEVDRLASDVSKKDEENIKLAQRCKELDEDRARQLRISNSHQTSMEKVKKQNEEMQIKVNTIEIQMGALKKENEALKRDGKKSGVDQQHLELRLSRALEEIEKYKAQAQKSSVVSRETTEQEKKRIEQLVSENKRLQKQKTELIQAFKKQLKLIDILKKMKMHLEAARILQFSEEEFINALEWDAANGPGQAGGSQPGSSRNLKATQRPPSGRQGLGSTGKTKPQKEQKGTTRSTSLASVNPGDGADDIKPQNENLMLDNLDYLAFDDDNGDDGENYYQNRLMNNSNNEQNEYNANYEEYNDEDEN